MKRHWLVSLRMFLLCSLVHSAFRLAAGPTPAAAAGMTILPGHVLSATAHLSAKGTLPETNHLNLAIGLPLRDATRLQDYLSQLYNPASSVYRHYLTPEQFTKEFGPTEQDYQAVIAFARQNHLTVTATYANRLLLDVNGSVADIQKAFHITLQTYQHPAEARLFYAPNAEPTVDAGLPISDISGLNNYLLPHPKSLKVNSARVVPRSGSGSGGAYMGNDFRAAYLPGVTLTGSGQLLGLLEFDGYYASDISAYEQTASLPVVPLQTVLFDGYNGVPTTGPNSGNGEVSLDIEMAISMAPGLSGIVVFEAGPGGLPNDILNAMASSNQIHQLSCSWGWSGGPSTTTDNIFKQMAAQGQSFFNAAGDSDAFTVGANLANGVDNTSLDNAPSSCPYITVVGGTTLTTIGPGGSWASETAWNWGLHNGSYVGTSGGVSSYYSIPNWQVGVSMASNGGSTANRNIPDVALTADNIFVDYGNGSSGTFGGTSCAAPLWAALTALINQQAISAARPVVGFINPAIYTIGNGADYSASFHDITTGNNTSQDSPTNYYAVPGYDLCTGWGTPMGQNLINALAGPADPLGISPVTGFNAVGLVGGPFNPVSSTFLLTNGAASSLRWSVINMSAWLQASSAGGELAVGASTQLTVSLTTVAGNLPAGLYTTDLQFSNWNSHVAQNVSFSLLAEQSLVQNGGFETGDFTGWTLAGNGTVVTPFGTTVYNAVESSGSYSAVVHSGKYGAFLGDIRLATLTQTLATAPGQSYVLSLWVDNITNGTGQEFQVNWNGGNIYGLTNPPAFAWTNLQFIVTAANASTPLQIGAENAPAYFGLDDVSVTPVPVVEFQSAAESNGSFQIAWAAATNLVYLVQYKTNLLQPAWINLTKPMVATNSVLSASDSAPSTQRYYRLVLAP